MKCPHCLSAFHDSWKENQFAADGAGYWTMLWTACPSCARLIVKLRAAPAGFDGREFLVQPRGVSRAPLSKDVPDKFAEDYREACLVLADSPKASAALSRRCLQHLLHEHAGITRVNLEQEITAVMPTLPSYLAEAIDSVRNIGNFGAHPTKSTNTGAIIDVEPGEAEWLLSTLEGLFDFYFVQPAVLKRQRAALDAKLAEGGKKPMK